MALVIQHSLGENLEGVVILKKIKFRGKDIFTGEIIFGDLLDEGKEVFIRDRKSNKKTFVQVDPESVAQLVGCDCAGNEIYEGDKLITKVGVITYAANIAYPATEICNNENYLTDSAKKNKWKLVKDD